MYHVKRNLFVRGWEWKNEENKRKESEKLDYLDEEKMSLKWADLRFM